MNRGLVAVVVAGMTAAVAVVILMRDDGAESPLAVSETSSPSTEVESVSTTTASQGSTTVGTASTDCNVVDVRVTANGPIDGVGIRSNPEFEVTATFLESGGDAILHVNTGYQDEANDQWVTFTWIEGGNLPTAEEAAIPNGTYDAASGALTGTETLDHYVDFEPVAGSPIAAPFTATYEPANLVVTGSVVLSDGSHTFTLAAQQIDILEGPGCPVVTDTPSP